VDGSDLSLLGATEELHEDPPNAVAWAAGGETLLLAGEDGIARVVSVASRSVVRSHAVREEPEAGKRPRCHPVSRLAVLGDGAFEFSASFVAAAGRVAHCYRLSDGTLEHVCELTSPVHALCAAPRGEPLHWAYALAVKGCVRLVSRAGATVHELQIGSVVRSLASSGQWLAAAEYDGTLKLWGLSPVTSPLTLRGYCGTDGKDVQWSADGGGLAASGSQAVVFDFTGAQPPHPYRSQPWRPAAGKPDSVPRVCIGHRAAAVAWAGGEVAPPPTDEWPPDPATPPARLATVDPQGLVRVWQPRSLPLRKGGQGNPTQPQLMKPQLYTFVRQDATHPSGEAAEPCALLWLAEDTVAVGYASGEIVAFQVT